MRTSNSTNDFRHFSSCTAILLYEITMSVFLQFNGISKIFVFRCSALGNITNQMAIRFKCMQLESKSNARALTQKYLQRSFRTISHMLTVNGSSYYTILCIRYSKRVHDYSVYLCVLYGRCGKQQSSKM